jgi:N-acetylglutamate synthase-like GNAT family acetyltransferase
VKDHSTSPQPALSCVIRRASAEDAGAIQTIYRELVDDSSVRVLPEQVAALAETPASFLLVTEAEGAVCATALLTICADVMYQFQPFGVVENVVVARSNRGRGIGRQLLAHVEQLAIARDCTKLMLLSSAHRHQAHAFFRRCGFVGDTKNAFVKYRSRFSARWD